MTTAPLLTVISRGRSVSESEPQLQEIPMDYALFRQVKSKLLTVERQYERLEENKN